MPSRRGADNNGETYNDARGGTPMQSKIGSIAHRFRYAIAAGCLVALAGLFLTASASAPGALHATINLRGSPTNQPVDGFPWTEQGIALYRGDQVGGRAAFTTETSTTGRVSVRLPGGSYTVGPWPAVGGALCDSTVVIRSGKTTTAFIVCSTS